MGVQRVRTRRLRKEGVVTKTGISWTDITVNPLTGCSRASSGCKHCYAGDASPGLLAKGQLRNEGLTILNDSGHNEWTGKISYEPKELRKLKRRKGCKIFINSMSDTFHAAVKREWLDEMFQAMLDNPQHTYQLLTKRPALMLKYIRESGLKPQSNMWLGFSAEDQDNFDVRMKFASQIADLGWKVWVSVEPQIAPIVLGEAVHKLCWVVIGGESTKPYTHAREFDIAWAISLIRECRAAGVAAYMKQLGVRPYWTYEGKAYAYKKSKREGKVMADWPKEIQVQDYPAL